MLATPEALKQDYLKRYADGFPRDDIYQPWTSFMDMHSGGRLKLDPFQYIYLQARQEDAEKLFELMFDRYPGHITCSCCGEDYGTDCYDDLLQATGYNRGCLHVDGKYVEKRTPKYFPTLKRRVDRTAADVFDTAAQQLHIGVDWAGPPAEPFMAVAVVPIRTVDAVDESKPHSIEAYADGEDVLVVTTAMILAAFNGSPKLHFAGSEKGWFFRDG